MSTAHYATIVVLGAVSISAAIVWYCNFCINVILRKFGDTAAMVAFFIPIFAALWLVLYLGANGKV